MIKKNYNMPYILPRGLKHHLTYDFESNLLYLQYKTAHDRCIAKSKDCINNT